MHRFPGNMRGMAGLQQLGHQAGPAGLMRGADATAGVSVKIFMEQDVVLEVRIGREFRVILQHGALAKGTLIWLDLA